MTAKSPEAIARKNKRKREMRAAVQVEQSLPIGVSKTSASYRRRLPRTEQLTSKPDLRAFLEQVFRNTASGKS